MSPSTHRIRRQTWLVRLSSAASSQADAMRVRTELNNGWSDASSGEFEQACDDAAPDDVVLRIPRLTLHVRVANSNELSTVLPTLISAQLAEQIREVGKCVQRGESTGGVAVYDSTTAIESFENLVYYLRSGSLPWSVSGKAPSEILNELREALTANLARIVQQLHSEKSEHSWFRLLQLLNSNYDDLIATLKDVASQNWSNTFASSFRKMMTITHSNAMTNLRVGAAIITATVDGSSQLSERAAASIRALSEIDQDRLRAWVATLPDSTEDSAYAVLKHALAGRSIQNEFATVVPDNTASHTAMNSVLSLRDQTKHAVSLGEPVQRQSVASAGLILLHPFLQTFLQRVGLNIDNEVSLETLPRAAALLHHLATGRTEIHEFELGFIKVLLGLAPETELPVTEGLLTAQDIAESDAMIGAMIGHWTAIGKTSVAGIRSTFLARIGLLALEDHGWTLHLAASSVDILLDRLPWGFGVVRLPWMDRTLYTQWTH